MRLGCQFAGLAVAVLALLLVGCGGRQQPTSQCTPAQTRAEATDDSEHERASLADRLAEAEVIDLTHRISADIPVFPGGKRFALKNLGTIEEDGYYINQFTMGEHVGTHVDAPAHFVANQPTVDELAGKQLVGPAAVIDISGQVEDDPDYALSGDDVHEWEQEHGELGDRHIVLVRTGWTERWPDEERFRNTDDEDVMHYPGISVEASTLLRTRGVRGIGIDTLSTDPGVAESFPQHKDFLASGGFHIENLANLSRLPPSGAFVVVGVLPLKQGSGAPARVLAFVPPERGG